MSCASVEALIDWAAEGDEAVELHLLDCHDCATRALSVLALAEALREVVIAGGVQMSVSRGLLAALARLGVKVQTFRLAEGAVVPCEAAHDRGLIVLELPIALREQADLSMLGPDGSLLLSAEDLAYRPGAEEVLLSAPAQAWAGIPAMNVTFRLTSGGQAHDFTMEHRAAEP